VLSKDTQSKVLRSFKPLKLFEIKQPLFTRLIISNMRTNSESRNMNAEKTETINVSD